MFTSKEKFELFWEDFNRKWRYGAETKRFVWGLWWLNRTFKLGMRESPLPIPKKQKRKKREAAEAGL